MTKSSPSCIIRNTGGDGMTKPIYDGNLFDRYDYESHKFLNVASCGVHVNVEHITRREKGRQDYHLLYVESGEMICEVNGRQEVLRPGGYVLYSPQMPQTYEQNGGICYWVHFSGSAADEILSDAGLKMKPFFIGNKPNRSTILSFERMVYRFVTEGYRNGLALSAELLSLLSSLKYCGEEERANAVDDRLLGIVTYMNKHYDEELDIECFATMLSLSPGRFAHLFKESMGVSPYAYLLGIRLEKAAELLSLSDIPIYEVAYKTGFSDPLYFSKMFKREYALSPKSFRKEMWKKLPRRTRSTGCD